MERQKDGRRLRDRKMDKQTIKQMQIEKQKGRHRLSDRKIDRDRNVEKQKQRDID